MFLITWPPWKATVICPRSARVCPRQVSFNATSLIFCPFFLFVPLCPTVRKAAVCGCESVCVCTHAGREAFGYLEEQDGRTSEDSLYLPSRRIWKPCREGVMHACLLVCVCVYVCDCECVTLNRCEGTLGCPGVCVCVCPHLTPERS